MFQRNYRVIGIAGIIFAILLLAIIIIIPILQSQESSNEKDFKNQITFTNLSNYYPDLPTNIQQNIINVLNDILTANQPDNNLSEYNINLNPNYPYILQYNYSEQIYYGEFTADIPNIEQSYIVSFNYTDNSDIIIANPVDITCPTQANQIYPNFKCNELGQH